MTARVTSGETLEYYVTFGVQYAHTEHPRWPHAHPDGWLTVEAPDEDTARTLVVALLGRAWSCLYTADDLEPEYYPRGELGRLAMTDGSLARVKKLYGAERRRTVDGCSDDLEEFLAELGMAIYGEVTP